MRAVAFCLVSVTVMATSCGGSSNANRSVASTNGEGSKPPSRVILDAVRAAGRASSVHVVGRNIPTVTGKGPVISFDLWIARGKGARGWFTKQGFRIHVIRVGDAAYVRGSDALYRHFGGSAEAQLLHGRWLTSTGRDPLGGLGYFTALPAFLTAFELTPAHIPALARGATPNVRATTFAGHRAFAIRENTRLAVTRFFVAGSGPPYLLAIVARPSSGAPAQALRFSHWNAAIPLSRPKHAIDISKLRSRH
jgi:hypothetical protein